MQTHDQLQGTIRYAIRLCERTSRLYRRMETAGTFFAIIGCSATIGGALGDLPTWVTAAGSVLLTFAGAAMIAVRPADKAAQNDSDIRRYQALMTKSHAMTVKQLAVAIEEAHQGDAPEVEPLRNVAYNDTVIELNRADQAIALSRTERMLKAIA